MNKIIILMAGITIAFVFFFLLPDYSEDIPAFSIAILVFSGAVIGFIVIGAFKNYDYQDALDVFPLFTLAVAFFITGTGFYIAAIHSLVFSKANLMGILFTLIAFELGLFGRDIGVRFAQKNNLSRKEILDSLASESIIIALPIFIFILEAT